MSEFDPDDPPECSQCGRLISSESDLVKVWTCEHDWDAWCLDCVDATEQAADLVRIMRASYHW